jgi:restriction system protein
MSQIYLIDYVAIALIIIIFCYLIRPNHNRRHHRNIKTSERCLKKLRTFQDSKYVFGYMRKIDPFVFEELILSAFASQGYQVQRSKRYSGDGGIDGSVKIDKVKYLIQVKRYRGHIKLSHVKDFIDVCKNENRKGLFIHTGKTGREVKILGGRTMGLNIISGGKLIDLVQGKKVIIN